MSNNTKCGISLGVRLISIIVVVVTLILAGIGALQYFRTRSVYTKLVDEGLNAACVRLSGNLGSPLWNFNREQTTEVLNAEMAQAALVAIAVHMGTDTKVFSGSAKTSAGRVEPIDDEAVLPRSLLKRTFEVPWEGNTIATGTVYYSLSSLQQTLHAQVVSTLVQALLTDLLLIVLISLVLSSIVVRPLGSLTGVANSVASGNFSGSVIERAVAALRDIAKKLHRDELFALTNTFDHMLVNLQARDTELESHRKNLEQLVADRTAALTKRNEEMRLVLDNVDEGLVLVSPDGTMSEERSAAFTRFFGNSALQVDACIFEDPKARTFFRLGYDQLADGFMPVTVVLDQLPKNAQRGSCVFGLRYQPLMQGDECSGVLFMINDITCELLAQRKDRDQYEQIRVFERWMRDRNGFVEFFNEARYLVEQIHNERYASPEERLRVIHTIKGNVSLFDVLSVADVAHALESALVAGEHEEANTLQADLVETWDAFAHRVALLIGDDLSERFELSRPELEDIISGLRGGQPTNEIVRRLVSITHEPMKLRFSRIEQQLRSLAKRLHKAPVECIMRGEMLRLPPDRFAPFWAVFPHVVRNVADHGFERLEERERLGKPTHNRVTLAAAIDAQNIELTVADDGHGVSWDRVAAKAENLGMPHATRKDLVNALFSPGFSTAEQVTAISGRGVGLSAIALEVSKLKGSVSLESEPNKGTQLRFTFPRSEQSDARPSVIPVSMQPISTRPRT
jgi:two-component system, chemotaxis family, sensor kinase CheA